MMFGQHGVDAGVAATTAMPRRKWMRIGLAIMLSAATLSGGGLMAHATDTMPWGNADPTEAAGQNQPYTHGYTGLDIMNWSPAADKDSEYLRSRVPLQPRIAADASTQRNPDLPADTEMFNLAGDYGNAFFESFQDNNVFSQYLFNYWQYTDFYGTWHGQPTQDVNKSLYGQVAQSDWTQKWFEFGTLNLPNPAYTNAAHRNGVRSIATIFFSDNDRGEQTYKDLLQGRRKDGTYPVADKLVRIAEYYGFDGYFFNQESAVDPADVEAYRDFMHQIVGKGIYIQWYDSATYPDGRVSYQNMFNAKNSPWVRDARRGKISDSIFLNYWFGNAMLKQSAEQAASLGLNPKQSVFAGLEAGQHRFDSIDQNADSMKVNLDSHGKPYVSLAALGTDFVSSDLGDDKKIYPQYQNEVFDRERRLWTGSSKGDGTDEADGWQGFASQIAERSVISGPVFSTTFNTGHGLEWRDGGKRTSTEQWGNINLQDVLPTWQWWIDANGDPLQADFDYGGNYEPAQRFHYQKVGAYEGGDSLVLGGRLSSDNTIRLYKTNLDVKAGSAIDLTYDKVVSDDSKLQIGVVFSDDTKTVVPLDAANGAKTDGWRTVSANLSQYAGKRIVTLGLIVKAGGQPIDNYQVNIGKLTVTDGENHTPAAPANFHIEKLFKNTSEATVTWNIADYSTTKNYLLYLDDTFIGGRYDDTLYIKKLPATSGMLKLYAVGVDGSRSLAAETFLDEAGAVSGLRVEPDKNGNVKVSWSNPASNGDKTVSLKSSAGSWRYSDHPYATDRTVSAASTGVTIANAPVDGSGYTLTVGSKGGSFASVSGHFADATIEPYPVCSVAWVDANQGGPYLQLVRPLTQDWRYIYVTERWRSNGKEEQAQRTFTYTYSQKTPPIAAGAVRGRTTAASYELSYEPSRHSTFWVSYQDYNGNTTMPVQIPTQEAMPSCVSGDPTAAYAGRSSLASLPGSALADGKSTRTVEALVKDSFGNPQTNAEVEFALPDGLDAARGMGAGADTGTGVRRNVTIATNADGKAALVTVSRKAGTYTVDASVNGVLIGKGVEIEFAPVGAGGPARSGGLAGTGHHTVSVDGTERLSDTGSSVAGATAVVGALLLAAAMIVLLRYKR